MTVPEGHVYIDLLQVLREQDDILANEAAREIERLRTMIETPGTQTYKKMRDKIIEECARVVELADKARFPTAVPRDILAAHLRALKSDTSR